MTNLTLRYHWGYITDVSKYHNEGIQSMDYNTLRFMFKKTYSLSDKVL